MMRSIRLRLARPFRQRAKAAQAAGRWDDALANLTIATTFDPKNPAVLLQIANIRTELAQFEPAEAAYRQVAQTPRFAIRAAVGLAGLSERTFDWDTASKRWDAVLQLMADEDRPEDDRTVSPAFALLHSALCRERIGDGSGADRDLVMAIALDPRVRREREAYLMRARMAGYKNNALEGLRLLRAAHKRYPADRTILFELTIATIRAGDLRAAAAFAKELLASLPGDPGTLALIREHRLVLDGQSVG